MAIFDRIKKQTIAKRKTDQAFYSAVAKEMEEGVRHNGLWLKALEHAGGNEEKQIAEYIKLRVQSLKDDATINSDEGCTQKKNKSPLDVEKLIKMMSNQEPVQMIEAYIENLDSEQMHELINTPDLCEDYPIHVAVKMGRLDLLKSLLEAGANPLVRNYWGKTALEIAEKNEDQDAASLLRRYKQ